MWARLPWQTPESSFWASLPVCFACWSGLSAGLVCLLICLLAGLACLLVWFARLVCLLSWPEGLVCLLGWSACRSQSAGPARSAAASQLPCVTFPGDGDTFSAAVLLARPARCGQPPLPSPATQHASRSSRHSRRRWQQGPECAPPWPLWSPGSGGTAAAAASVPCQPPPPPLSYIQDISPPLCPLSPPPVQSLDPVRGCHGTFPRNTERTFDPISRRFRDW